MLKIMESEIDHYYRMLGDITKTRALYSMETRYGHVMFGDREFFCKFRPTLSMPKGIEDFDDIRKHSLPHLAVQLFKTQAYGMPAQAEEREQKEDLLGPEQLRVIEVLHEGGDQSRSIRHIQQAMDKGRETTLKLLHRLESRGYIELVPTGSRKVVRLTPKGKRICSEQSV
jgi:DNA-binding MarR family transcriptional regulator